MKTTTIKTKSGKKITTAFDPKNYREVKIKNRKYPTVSTAIRSLLLSKKNNLTDTSAYHEIAELCEVTYPLVSHLAHEMLKAVNISKKEKYETVVDATEILSKTHSMEHIASICKVPRPCIEVIMKVRKLSKYEKK